MPYLDTVSLSNEWQQTVLLLQEAMDVPESMFGGEELRLLADEMVRTMRAAPGVGLAGPQIGKGLKVHLTPTYAAAFTGLMHHKLPYTLEGKGNIVAVSG